MANQEREKAVQLRFSIAITSTKPAEVSVANVLDVFLVRHGDDVLGSANSQRVLQESVVVVPRRQEPLGGLAVLPQQRVIENLGLQHLQGKPRSNEARHQRRKAGKDAVYHRRQMLERLELPHPRWMPEEVKWRRARKTQSKPCWYRFDSAIALTSICLAGSRRSHPHRRRPKRNGKRMRKKQQLR